MTTFPIRFVTQFANFKLPEVAKERHICQHNKLSLENARRQTEENRKGDETPTPTNLFVFVALDDILTISENKSSKTGKKRS